MMSERIRHLKELQYSTKPSISVERGRLATEAKRLYAQETPILQRAKTLAYIMEHMSIFIDEGALIVGNHTTRRRCAPFFPEYGVDWLMSELPIISTRGSDPLVLSDEERQEMIDICHEWQENGSYETNMEKQIPAKILEAEACGVMTVGSRISSTGHIVPNYTDLFHRGLNGLIAECEEKLAETPASTNEAMDQRNFWNASIISSKAVITLANRFSKLAADMAASEADPVRKAELLEISSNCANVPANPPKSFFEAVQFVWFIHLAICIETNGHANSFGTFDRYVDPLYEADLAKGVIDERKALDIMENFYLNCTDIIKIRGKVESAAFAGFPQWQNIMLGGMAPDGSDASNECSKLMLKANAEVKTSSPTLSVRYHEKLDPEVFEMGIAMIQQGMSTPAYFNDNLMIQLALQKGATTAEARNYAVFGCVQPCIQGYHDGRPTGGFLNSLKVLELTMHNGFDPQTGKQLGPKTGEFTSFKTFAEFKQAFFKQMDYFIQYIIDGFNVCCAYHSVYGQNPFASTVIGGCIEKGKSLQRGGAKYSDTGIFCVCVANTADSLTAIEQFVYNDKTITAKEMLDILDSNFVGHEDIREMFVNKAPKYGNDNDVVDAQAASVIKHYRDYIEDKRDSRGGRFGLTLESQSFNVVQGQCVGATPDGRKAFEPVADNASPYMGRDTSGPTASVRSVAKLDQNNATAGTLYNLRFDPRAVEGEKGRQVIGGVIKTYFKNNGEHIQINVVDDATLRDAQKNPENYRDLIVRVAGYMAYFTELDKSVQDALIARTSHTVDC